MSSSYIDNNVEMTLMIYYII